MVGLRSKYYNHKVIREDIAIQCDKMEQQQQQQQQQRFGSETL